MFLQRFPQEIVEGETLEQLRGLEYARRNASGIGLLAISYNSLQGFEIETFGETDCRPTRICGINLIAEKWSEEEEDGDK